MSDWDLAEAHFNFEDYCQEYQRAHAENMKYTNYLEALDRKQWLNSEIYKPNLRFD